MFSNLDRARERFESGRDKQALRDLWVAEAQSRANPEALKHVLDVATAIRDRNRGSIRNDAELLIREVKPRLTSFRDASADRKGASGERGISAGAQMEKGPQLVASGWVTLCVSVFALAAILSVIGGVVGGIAASDSLGPQLRAQLEAEGLSADDLGIDTRDEAILVAGIIAGLVSAALWVGMAVLLVLVRDAASGMAALVRLGRSPAEPSTPRP